MKLIKCGDYGDMSRQAAACVAEEMKKLLESKNKFVLGLATGSTPVGVYQEWAKMNKEGSLDFGNVYTYNLDEYIGLAPEHDQSFSYFMFDNLFNHINIKKDNVHIPDGMAGDYDVFCPRYEEMIAQEGGLDLQLLGIGSNGHIGFNEPDSEFSDITHTVDLTESTIKDNSRFFTSADEEPKRAVTMGIGTILRARKIVMVVSGENKGKALNALINGPIDPQMPASALQQHADVTIYADEEALKGLVG